MQLLREFLARYPGQSVLLVVILLLLWQLRPILAPFVVGGLIAYLGDPVTDWLEERGDRRAEFIRLHFGSSRKGRVQKNQFHGGLLIWHGDRLSFSDS